MGIKAKFLRFLGDVKIQKWPPFLYWEPGDYYKVSGDVTDKVAGIVRPGDIILRGFRNYLDGFFIPGEYSHTGVFVGSGQMIHAVAEGVSYTTLTDFCRCDRVCVIRPRCGASNAVKRIRKWLGRPYDYDFTGGNSAYYCHELAAEAYRELDVKKVIPYIGWLRFCKMEPRFLAESFINSPDFTIIYENKGGRK